MSDFENAAPEDLSQSLAAEITGTVGLADDAGLGDAVPNHIADEVEAYEEYAERRDERLTEQPDHVQDEGEQVEQQQSQGKRQQHVPLGALQEERQRRQAAQAEAEQLRQQIAQFQAQQLAWQAQQQQLAAQQAEAEIPAFVDDPEGHLNALRQKFEAELADLRGAGQQRQQIEMAAAQVQQACTEVLPRVTQAEAEFRQTHADYDAAAAFVQQSVRDQLMAQHPGATPQQIAVVEQAAALDFFGQCFAKGIDGCQHIYQRAQQLGFQTQARTPRKAAPTSLSTLPASGRAPDQRGALSASQVSQMSAEQFDAFWREMEANSVQQPWG